MGLYGGSRGKAQKQVQCPQTNFGCTCMYFHKCFYLINRYSLRFNDIIVFAGRILTSYRFMEQYPNSCQTFQLYILIKAIYPLISTTIVDLHNAGDESRLCFQIACFDAEFHSYYISSCAVIWLIDVTIFRFWRLRLWKIATSGFLSLIGQLNSVQPRHLILNVCA